MEPIVRKRLDTPESLAAHERDGYEHGRTWLYSYRPGGPFAGTRDASSEDLHALRDRWFIGFDRAMAEREPKS